MRIMGCFGTIDNKVFIESVRITDPNQRCVLSEKTLRNIFQRTISDYDDFYIQIAWDFSLTQNETQVLQQLKTTKQSYMQGRKLATCIFFDGSIPYFRQWLVNNKKTVLNSHITIDQAKLYIKEFSNKKLHTIDDIIHDIEAQLSNK